MVQPPMTMMTQRSITLGIETSCDETAIAILENDTTLLANLLFSQVEIHAAYGGVVPEVASRSHLEKIFPILDAALHKAEIDKHEITGIVATHAPGLIGCLLVGTTLGKALAYAWKKPFRAVNHIEGHIHAPFLEFPDFAYPYLSLTVSGGHTAIYRVLDLGVSERLGHTVDDAAGEVLDKIARLAGLGYPGGPVIDRLAKLGDKKAFPFSRSHVKRGPLFMSFSGLKTEARRIFERVLLVEHPYLKDEMNDPRWPERVKSGDLPQVLLDFVASFQEGVMSELLAKFKAAHALYPDHALSFSGGVSVNSRLREKAKLLFGEAVYFSSPKFCTDNAAMIAYVGRQYLKRGNLSPLHIPTMPRDGAV